MRRKRKIKDERFCEECGRKLSILNKGNVCFKHVNRNVEEYLSDSGYSVVSGSSSGPSGSSARQTQIQENGRYSD